MKKNYLISIIIVIFLFGFYLWGFLAENELDKRGILLNAKTSHWVYGTKTRGLEYIFYYKGGKITSNNPFEKFVGNKDFEDKNFPVIYDPKFGSSQLLIEPSNFERFNLPFPDSLKWVLKYLK